MQDRGEQIRRAKAAIAALERGPTPDELERAPHADLWRVLVDDVDATPVIWAKVSGHPLLGGDDVVTSRLIGIDREAGWARTLSRWYRLGTPFATIAAGLAARMGRPDAPADVIEFHLPGFMTLDDDALLDAILDRFIELVKAIDQ